jgi:hypothetical protein
MPLSWAGSVIDARSWGFGLKRKIPGKLRKDARSVVNGTNEVEEVISLFVCIVDMLAKPTLMLQRI